MSVGTSCDFRLRKSRKTNKLAHSETIIERTGTHIRETTYFIGLRKGKSTHNASQYFD